MRTRTSPRNQDRLFKALFKAPVNPEVERQKRMTVLRMRLERERNSPRPNGIRIDSMMQEYKRLETKAHVAMVFGEEVANGSSN